MAGYHAGLRWRQISVRESILKSAASSLSRDLTDQLVRTPLVVVCALWIICLPAMYFALYGDLVSSVGTLAQMTVFFLGFLMIFLVGVVSLCLLISCSVYALRRIRWRKLDYGL